MKTIAIVPIKQKSERVPGKNFKNINGKPLYKFMLEKIVKCEFDEVFVDTDSKKIKNFCRQKNIKIIDRLKKLSKNSASGNDLLNYHQKIIDADIYFQVFITSPLMKIETINNCIKFLKKNKKHDSILTAKSNYTWYWFNNKPVNYNPKFLPRSQDAKPVVVETTGLYGITKNSLKKRKCRIGYRPYFYEVSDEECIDLDTKEDFIKLRKI
jgi:CMP-N-acetylneuraminic acid synthetase